MSASVTVNKATITDETSHNMAAGKQTKRKYDQTDYE